MADCMKIGKNFLMSSAELVERLSKKYGNKKGAICGRDILLGMAMENHCKRYNSWIRWEKEMDKGFTIDEENRDGAWVPAIYHGE